MEQIQLVVRVGPKLEISRFQVRHPDHVKINIVYMKYPRFGFGEPRIGVFTPRG